MKKKRRGKLTGGLLFPQDNARVHYKHLSTTTATNCGFKILPYPSYSPDVAPSDYHLFPEMEKGMRGIKFQSTDDAKNHVLEFWKQYQFNNSHTKTLKTNKHDFSSHHAVRS